MTGRIGRRQFLVRAWKVGVGLIAAAGAWTTWDVLKLREGAGALGPVRTVPVSAVPEEGVLEVSAIRGYLTRADNQVVALWWKCPHLGCRVPWCESSGQFECPCHGSVFNRVGEYRRGPAPRGMDRYAMEVVDGQVVVDTSDVTYGDPPGTETINEPPLGPECLEAGEDA